MQKIDTSYLVMYFHFAQKAVSFRIFPSHEFYSCSPKHFLRNDCKRPTRGCQPNFGGYPEFEAICSASLHDPFKDAKYPEFWSFLNLIK